MCKNEPEICGIGMLTITVLTILYGWMSGIAFALMLLFWSTGCIGGYVTASIYCRNIKKYKEVF